MELSTMIVILVVLVIWIGIPAFVVISALWIFCFSKEKPVRKPPPKWLITEHKLCDLSHKNRLKSIRKTKARDRLERRQRRRI